MRRRMIVLTLVAAFLLALAAPVRAAGPPSAPLTPVAGDAMAVASASCAALKRRANRHRRGSAKRRRYIRRYKKCRARVRRERQLHNSTPSAPAPAPPATPTLPAGPLYLPSIFPNPNGYRSGGGCLPGYEQTYRLAGYSCQYAGYNHYLFTPGGPIWTPVYLLFGIWYCADGQFRFRC